MIFEIKEGHGRTGKQQSWEVPMHLIVWLFLSGTGMLLVVPKRFLWWTWPARLGYVSAAWYIHTLSSHLDLRGAGVEDTVQLIALRNCALAHLRTTSILISTSVLFHTLKAPYSWLLHELHWQTNPPDMLLSHSY